MYLNYLVLRISQGRSKREESREEEEPSVARQWRLKALARLSLYPALFSPLKEKTVERRLLIWEDLRFFRSSSHLVRSMVSVLVLFKRRIIKVLLAAAVMAACPTSTKSKVQPRSSAKKRQDEVLGKDEKRVVANRELSWVRTQSHSSKWFVRWCLT